MPPPAYKPTMFDRHGPNAGLILRASGYAPIVLLISLMGFGFAGTSHGYISAWATFAWIVLPSLGVTALYLLLGFYVGEQTERAWQATMAGEGSTPYVNQFSREEALIMQGRTDEALRSFEVLISESPWQSDVRLRAAEVYAGHPTGTARAAELFREVQDLPGVAVGSIVYATNRLVDLLTGPLDDPGRAMGELRRLIDRYPESAGAARAREALVTMKARRGFDLTP